MRIISALVIILLVLSCERETPYKDPDAFLQFSEDTIFFDTIFTTIGSTTKQLRVYNRYDQPLELNSVRLAGGDQSVFRLNIDGIPGNAATGVEILPDDSIYIFIEVTLDPNNTDSLLVIQDSIIFNTNGNIQDVDLVAWGQDVHLIRGDTLQTTTWINDKPYLVYQTLWIDSGHVLTIDPGVKVYFHKYATMVVKGTVNINGTLDEPVVFQGDRLEELYSDIPGQWNGIYFWPGTSRDNTINYLVMKNGIFGIWSDSLATTTTPNIHLTNTIIQNMSSSGIFGRGTSIRAENCVIADCGQFAVALIIGGSYEFYHCTIVNYWGGYSSTSRTTPALFLNNYYEDINGDIQVREIENAYFGNCIIYGSLENEFEVDSFPGGRLDYKLEYCLTKIDTSDYNMADESHFRGIINKIDPKLLKPGEFNYSLDTLSPAMDAGLRDISVNFPLDLAGVSRLADAGPDIGAYERIEKEDIERRRQQRNP
jgi:hypothetical protein